jgi:TorA maturation chaperone TorD
MTLSAPTVPAPTTASLPDSLPAELSAQRDWMPLLTGEALVCGLLGRLLYAEPDQAWLQTLAAEAVFDEIPFGAEQPEVLAGLELLQKWSRDHRAGLPDEVFARMRGDYARLFQGPGKLLAAPWESAQITAERQLFQGPTLQVRGWYRRFGLEAARLHTEPDDHIGLELSFLARLAQLGLEALAQADEPRLNQVLAAQRDFLKAHPLRWTPLWCDQVEQHARTCFFRGVARVTRGVLAELAATFGLAFQVEAAR